MIFCLFFYHYWRARICVSAEILLVIFTPAAWSLVEISCHTSQKTGCSSTWFHSVSVGGTKRATRAAPSACAPGPWWGSLKAAQAPTTRPEATAMGHWQRCSPCKSHTQIRGQRGQQRFTEKQHPSWWDHMVWKLIIFLMISDGSVWACKSEGNSPGHSKLTVVYSIKSLKRSWLSFGPCWLAVSQNFPGRVWELGQAKGHSSWAISHFSVNSYYSALSWVHASW